MERLWDNRWGPVLETEEMVQSEDWKSLEWKGCADNGSWGSKKS
jgi:hypothetical protein